ncbi:hypothetical protein [Limosilactobacillus urinaemulieris]|uniref:hypothetical protein n=1 Tax=Limosilactobacillus urinaemulieris TaxID=2742600 RepID=UPI001F598576|nr:hypothetical protein [Limosilactobacillus urinaemulieris]
MNDKIFYNNISDACRNGHEKDWVQRYEERLNLTDELNVTNAMGAEPTVADLTAVPKAALDTFKAHHAGIILLHITQTQREVDFIFTERATSADPFDQLEVDHDNKHFLTWRDPKFPSLRRVQALRYDVDQNGYEIAPINVNIYGKDKLGLIDPWFGYEPFLI